MLEYISMVAIPLLILVVLFFGISEKKEILAIFAEGAIEGLNMIYKIFPHILAIMVAISLFKETGAMGFAFKPVMKLLQGTGVSEEILTLACLRPISGGASNAIVMNIFENYGPDSVQGKIASILIGGTETTFYVITILFGAVGIKKIRGTMVAALLADFTATVLSVILVLKGFI